MSILEEAASIWDQFLKRWPLESLEGITLQQYTQAGDPDCFTYGWIEKSTDKLGSIWGGSAFKFGVYSRENKSDKDDKSGRSYNEKYAWYSKYGDTAEAAFANVLQKIIKVANAARNGDLALIDTIDLGEAFKWKLAFLYQDRNNPIILPIFKSDWLRAAIGSNEKRVSELQQQVMKNFSGKDILQYGNEVWESIQKKLSTELTPAEAEKFFNQSDRFTQVKEPTQKIAGYESTHGDQLALALDNKKTTLYLKAGGWLDLVKDRLQEIVPYAADKSRSSNLAANTPQLALGNAIVKVVVPTKAALIEVCDAYVNDEPINTDVTNTTFISKANNMQPLNRILYGPPGTGKTYATIDESLSILDPAYLKEHGDDRKMLKTKFDELTAAGFVRFVTFHQSFSYEDFVEGLRATTNDDKQLEYKVEPGVFKRLCDDARTLGAQPGAGIRSNPRIWKISINGTGSSPTLTYCLDHGEARIGWGKTGNLLQPLEGNSFYNSIGSGDRGTLRYFAEEMVPGDILLCIHSADMVNAVGVVTGDYRYDESTPSGIVSDYNHVRSVNWIYRDLKLPILPLNDDKQFTAKTVYVMDRFTWGDLLAYLEQSGAKPTNPIDAVTEHKPHVLIIDEINRGNISRIFGELITLVEPSKRAGSDEALEVTLPYSKRPFSVPSNVYLIGTMNTADRSLTGLDIALRRRFTFKEMAPNPELLDSIDIDGVNIGETLRKMNERIEVLLDRDHCLGHAYFMSLKKNGTIEDLSFIFRQQIMPLLQEYFFEDWERIAWVLNSQNKSGKDAFVQKTSADLTNLFGNELANNLQNMDRRWRINEEAFKNIECYRGILGAVI